MIPPVEAAVERCTSLYNLIFDSARIGVQCTPPQRMPDPENGWAAQMASYSPPARAETLIGALALLETSLRDRLRDRITGERLAVERLARALEEIGADGRP